MRQGSPVLWNIHYKADTKDRSANKPWFGSSTKPTFALDRGRSYATSEFNCPKCSRVPGDGVVEVDIAPFTKTCWPVMCWAFAEIRKTITTASSSAVVILCPEEAFGAIISSFSSAIGKVPGDWWY